jgi:histidine phosphotransfer protein HptB
MIDWKRVNELKAEIGDDGFGEVVEIFLDEVEDVLTRLQSSPDPTHFEEDMHFLKGGAWNLGFRQMGALCQEGESKAAQGTGKDIDIGGVLASYRASKEAFLSGLSNPASVASAA